jgi:uncharacterized repeat protein (TIGR01451 family)
MIAMSSSAIATESHLVRPGGSAIFTINVTNTGETPLNSIEIIDTLPRGMSYISDDNDPKGLVKGKKVIWPKIGPLDIGESKLIHITARIDKSSRGRLTNGVSVVGFPMPSGYSIRSLDKEYVNVEPPKTPRNKWFIVISV